MGNNSAPLAQSFEEALKELENIVEKFENNAWTLEESMVAYKRGLLLKDFCAGKLEEAKLVLETVEKTSGKNPASEPQETTLL